MVGSAFLNRFFEEGLKAKASLAHPVKPELLKTLSGRYRVIPFEGMRVELDAGEVQRVIYQPTS
jgi:hypothetical protein